MTRFLYVLVAEYLLQRAYDEHLFGVGPLDHVNRPRAGTQPPSVLATAARAVEIAQPLQAVVSQWYVRVHGAMLR